MSICPKNPRSVEISLPLPPIVSYSSTVHFHLNEYAFGRVGGTLFAGNNGDVLVSRYQKRTHLSSLPLQLKTRRFFEGMEHHAQTMLYTLLPWGRYRVDTQDRLPFSNQSEGEDVVWVPQGQNSPVDGPFLPLPIDDKRPCKRFYARDTFLGLRKAHPTHSSATPKKKRSTYDPPITPSWCLYSVQGQDVSLPNKWRSSEIGIARGTRYSSLQDGAFDACVGEREECGRRCSGMVVALLNNYGTADKTGGEWGRERKIHRYTYSFVQSMTWLAPLRLLPSRQRLNGPLNTGDPIAVSIEPNLLALARGYIFEL